MGAPLNPARAARRMRELSDRLGGGQPVCFYCGYSELVALRRVSGKSYEVHHPLGRSNDRDLTVVVCLNCHALLHEKLLDAGVNLRSDTNSVKQVMATMLRAEAVHFEEFATAKRRQAALLEVGEYGDDSRSVSPGPRGPREDKRPENGK